MRTENLVVTVAGLLAVTLAVLISWRWRRAPTAPSPVEELPTRRVAAIDGLRVLAANLAAATVAGFLVPGVAGRLLMRVLGATSGDRAQGRLTEADEVVGEITFGGSLAFVLFVGVLLPVFSTLPYLLIRRILPATAWAAGLVYGLILLALVGTADPLSPDNVDFDILRPLPLAIALISVTALLYGTTFVALSSHFESGLRDPGKRRARYGPFAAFVWLMLPPMAMASGVYMLVRVLSRGRVGVALDRVGNRWVTGTLVAAGTVVSVLVVVAAAQQILD